MLSLAAISVHPSCRFGGKPRGRARADLCGEGMKITALLVLKPSTSGAGSSSSGGESGPEAVVLANATDVSHFGYFQRSAAREFRSEEHTSELQSRSTISYAVFCLDRKSTRLNSSHVQPSRMPSSA